jgi:hypothetical protein
MNMALAAGFLAFLVVASSFFVSGRKVKKNPTSTSLAAN